jgi:TonB family protein
MSAHEAHNPLDLLQLGSASRPAVELHGAAEPQLDIGWGQFHQGIASNFAELFRRAGVSKGLLSASFFKDAWIERRIPRRAVFAAALWHVAFLVMPFPTIPGPKRNHAFDNAEITWSGPIEDFPLITAPAHKLKPSLRGTPDQPPAPEGADAFHPRQSIFTDPSRPNHPRQTLIQPAAPPDAPKILPNLPNMVQLAQSAEPVRPQIEISQKFLKQLRPKERRVATDPNAPAPEVHMTEQHNADLALAMNTAGPERPKLQINAGSAPRAAQHKQDGAAEPAPDVANQFTSPNGSGQTLIALSATPGPPAPAAPPPGNLAARVTISPEGKKPGVPGGSPDAKPSNGNNGADHAGGASASSAAGNSAGVSITGGSPKSPASGLGAGKLSMPSARPNYSRVDAAREEAATVQSGPPNFAALAPDAKPEAIFASRRIYSMNVNMPNLNSATGSWILNFTEMRTAPAGPASASSGEVAEPSPLRKVDPKYPPNAIAENIEGEVILYAVIRRDGSVDSIQLVKGIDPQLDGNAMRALAQWKFRPAERNGEPVDLEAVVHIPFHLPERN